MSKTIEKPNAEAVDLDRLVLPFVLRCDGHPEDLKCISLDSNCGDVKRGVAFEFGREGGWVVSLDDLENLCKTARKFQQNPSGQPRLAQTKKEV